MFAKFFNRFVGLVIVLKFWLITFLGELTFGFHNLLENCVRNVSGDKASPAFFGYACSSDSLYYKT